MTEYKKGDKVVVEIDGTDASTLNNDHDIQLYYRQILGKLEDFQLTENKIKFTPEMKKEFDKLKASCADLNIALSSVQGNLSCWLNHNGTNIENNKHQYLFSLAWHNPSLIEVVEPEKRNIKLGKYYLCLNGEGPYLDESPIIPDASLTLNEVREINDYYIFFKHIDLAQAWGE